MGKFIKGFKPTAEMIKKSNETKLKNGVFDRLIIRNKSQKQREAVGKALKGRKRNDIPWNTGMKGLQPWMNISGLSSKEGCNGEKTRYKKGNIPFTKGKPRSEETKEKIRKANTGRKLSKEFIKRCLRRREMSSLEILVNNVIIKYELPYKFVGNGDFFIERKNPDFINVNGQKIAVEVYCRRHKEKFAGGFENWKIEREGIFSKYGWQIIFIEEWQTKEEIILQLLK